MRTSLLIAALTGGLLAGSVVGVAAQDEADALQLVTEEVEPGVERIISDGVGHDLDETHPTNRYDMDGIAIAPDGTVWLTTTYHGSDNDANPEAGSLVWALGQPGIYGHEHGLPGPQAFLALVTLADGTLLATAHESDEFLRFDGGRFVPDDGPMLRQMADGGLLVRMAAADVVGQLPDGQATSIRDLYAVWEPQREGWTVLGWRGGFPVYAADHWCFPEASGVTCVPGDAWDRSWSSDEPTRYLTGTYIGHVAAALDGSVWAVGDYDDGPGGLYRITLPEPDAE